MEIPISSIFDNAGGGGGAGSCDLTDVRIAISLPL